MGHERVGARGRRPQVFVRLAHVRRGQLPDDDLTAAPRMHHTRHQHAVLRIDVRPDGMELDAGLPRGVLIVGVGREHRRVATSLKGERQAD
jgi:hypothetical protein